MDSNPSEDWTGVSMGISNLTSSIRGVSGQEEIYNIKRIQASNVNSDTVNTASIKSRAITASYIQLDTSYTDGSFEGRLQWNIDDGTMEYGLPGGNVTLQVGQEHLVRCRNTTGTLLGNGTVVYVSGAQGNRPLIAKAFAGASPLQSLTFGITTEPIANNANGYVTTEGLVRDVNTTGMAEGAPLFLSATPGEYTPTEPPVPRFQSLVGFCLREHANEGIVLARVHLVPKTRSLSDVKRINPAQSGMFLRWYEASGIYKPSVNASFNAATIIDLKASSLVASYINFTASRGVDGSGFRYQNGVLEVKNAGGEWIPFGLASEKFWNYSSPVGKTGVFYYGGFYRFAGSADDLSATPATTHGTALSSYAAHFMVVLGDTAVDKIVIRVKGTRITDTGVSTTSYEATLAIPNAATANNMYETPEKFIGQVTAKVISGTAKNVNYGFAKYWDNNNNNFAVRGLETTWLGGANDGAANMEVIPHKNTGWTYNAGAEPDPPTPIAAMNTDHVTEINVVDGEEGAWKRSDLNQAVLGNLQEGTILKLTTSANRAFESGTFVLRIENRAN